MVDSKKTNVEVLRNAESLIHKMDYELKELNDPKCKLKMSTLMRERRKSQNDSTIG